MFVEITTPPFLENEILSQGKIKRQRKPGVKKRLYCYGERCMAFREVLQYLIFSSALVT